MSVSGSPGVPEGPRSLLFREESRGTPFKGFLWATSSRRLDTALLFADKKRGVETYQAGRVLPVNPWSLDHGSSPKKPPLPRSTAKPSLPADSKKIAGLSSGDFRYLICCYMP